MLYFRIARSAKLRSWSRARLSYSATSISADRSSDRCLVLSHRAAAFSISPASVQ